MQIVQLSGGLGNQLFQYAYYLKLKKAGYETYIDDKSCYKTARDRNNQLRMMGACYDEAKETDILRLTDTDRHLKNWLRRRFTGSLAVERHEGDAITSDGYWVGYWQSANGYEEIADELSQNVFGTSFFDEGLDKKIVAEIKSSQSVSVHIRRGDYLNQDVVNVYGGICTDEYYQKALSFMRQKFSGCIFFVFSNDPEWVRENFKGEDIVVMEGNDEDHGYRDMYLMSLCKHNIIANSSFSWWGAWLNKNEEKCIIGPSVWIHRDGFDGIYDNFPMIKITSNGELVHE